MHTLKPQASLVFQVNVSCLTAEIDPWSKVMEVRQDEARSLTAPRKNRLRWSLWPSALRLTHIMDFVSRALPSPFHPHGDPVTLALVCLALVVLFAEDIRGWLLRPKRTKPFSPEFPRDTAFMASIAARPRETTYLSFVAPTPLETRQGVQPIVLRVFNGHGNDSGVR